jgi:hypothetical protein
VPRLPRQAAGAVSAAALVAMLAVCFARLIVSPSALIVDGRRPSTDHANQGDARPIGNDATFLFLPNHLSISQVISKYGHVPLWDARGFAGRPMLGNPQSGVFYPPVWVVWYSGAPAALGWLTIGHLLWGGIGVYVLSRSAGQGRVGATVAAVVYEASPFLLAHTFEGHYPHVWAASYYPWAFWAYGQLRSGRPRGFLLLPVFLALAYLTGHPQEWFLLILACSAWSLVDAAGTWRREGPTRAFARPLVWAAVLGFSLALSALALIPQLAAGPWLLCGQEAHGGPILSRRYHLQGLNAFQLLSPRALGGPADYFGNDNYWETVLSIGLVPLVLLVAAIRWHPDRKQVRGWLALVALAVWFAGGRHLGLYPLLYYVVPGMSWFRVPARSLFLANLGAALLVGLGAESLWARMTPQSWRRFARGALALLLSVVAALFVLARADESSGTGRTAEAARRVLGDGCFWLALCGTALAVSLASFRNCWRSTRLASALLGVLAICELGWHGNSLLKVAPFTRFGGNDPVGDALHRLGDTSPGSGPVRIKARDSFYGDLPAVCDGIEKTNVNDAFQLDHAARLYETVYPVASFRRPRRDALLNQVVEGRQRQIRQAVFDRMSVAFVVSDRFEPDPGWPIAAQGQWQGRHFVIQRNPTVLPRAYVVPRAVLASPGEAPDLDSLRELDPHESVLMSGDPLCAVSPGARQRFTRAEWVSTDPDRPVLQVTTSAPGLLVIADTWMAGWTARVDGAPAPCHRGNYAQRVVPLPAAGRHTITLDYRPPGLLPGCAITSVAGTAWVLACGFMIWIGVRAKLMPQSCQLQLTSDN